MIPPSNPQDSQGPRLEKSELFWQQYRDLHYITQVVLMFEMAQWCLEPLNVECVLPRCQIGGISRVYPVSHHVTTKIGSSDL